MTVLVLAGTTEARALAGALVARDIAVLASLAGRTGTPRPYPCPVRVGGFGGVTGLVEELRSRAISALIDATHPYASAIPRHAHQAAAAAGIPHLRLLRPPWTSRPGWVEVDDEQGAARLVSGRTFLALGRQHLDVFRDLDGVALVVRAVDDPPPGPWEVITGRGPFDRGDEVRLLRERRVDVLVTRNSGGSTALVDAAEECGVRVVVVRRPPPLGHASVATVEEAVEWVVRLGR